MKIDYEIYKDHKFLVSAFKGDFSFDHLKNYLMMLMKTDDWSHVECQLVDLRKATNFMDAISHLAEIQKLRSETVKVQIETIFLVSNPDNTAPTLLYVERMKKEFSYDIFSGIDNAVKKLNLNKPPEEVEAMINNLNNSF